MTAVRVCWRTRCCPTIGTCTRSRCRRDGTLSISNRTYWDIDTGGEGGPHPLSVQIGHRAGRITGRRGGVQRRVGEVVGSGGAVADRCWPSSTGTASARIEALTFTDRFDGTVGVPDLVAAGQQANSAWVLRYDGATTLRQLPVAAGSGGTKTDIGGIRAWFPGYKTGSVQFVNQSTSDDFELDFATRDNAAQGCWFTQDFADRAALPTTEVTVAAGQSSAVYALAARTAGDGRRVRGHRLHRAVGRLRHGHPEGPARRSHRRQTGPVAHRRAHRDVRRRSPSSSPPRTRTRPTPPPRRVDDRDPVTGSTHPPDQPQDHRDAARPGRDRPSRCTASTSPPPNGGCR